MLLWRGLRRAVLDPIENLSLQTRSLAAGNIGERITSSGPPEIAGLGDDVNAMRARIANELVRVEAARAELLVRTEDLARSNADLEQFAYIASHDLSEPLRKVANFCQLLERQYGDQLDDKAKQYIAFAVDGAKRMQILIADLLAFSRVGRTTEEFAEVDLDAVVFRALANLDQRITDAGAEIERDPLPTIRGDASLLTALFQNLIGNSVKYRSEEPPRIHLAVQREDDHWLFTLTDNGIGIDPKYGDRIFAIFQRLHLRDQYGGTGIGLALCRKIVEFHGGRIWSVDKPGPGASFQFTLADGAGVSVRRRGDRDPSDTMSEANRPLGVLLVEDDPGDVLIAQEALAAGRLSTELNVVSDGAEAIEYLRRRPASTSDVARPDLILLDLNLPGMTGHEVLAEVKADPVLRRIPVVVLTTSKAVEDVVRSYDLHASVYVTKPVDFDAFTDGCEADRRLLRQRRRAAQRVTSRPGQALRKLVDFCSLEASGRWEQSSHDRTHRGDVPRRNADLAGRSRPDGRGGAPVRRAPAADGARRRSLGEATPRTPRCCSTCSASTRETIAAARLEHAAAASLRPQPERSPSRSGVSIRAGSLAT